MEASPLWLHYRDEAANEEEEEEEEERVKNGGELEKCSRVYQVTFDYISFSKI